MTNKYEELIRDFDDKVGDLISEYKKLKSDYADLQRKYEVKSADLKQAHKEFVELQENYNRLRVARYLNDSPKEKKISKQYIDKLVREIDKCLALLDE